MIENRFSDMGIGIPKGGLKEFFGDGSDGVLDTTGNITFPTTIHSGLVVKQYESLTINNGHTVTVDNPCRGLVIYVQGDAIINGTIDMSKKAGLGSGDIPPLLIDKSLESYYSLTTILTSLKGGTGGNGGRGGGTAVGTNNGGTGGSGGTGRLLLGGFGGGGGGGTYYGSERGGNAGAIQYPDCGGGIGIYFAISNAGIVTAMPAASNGAGGTGHMNYAASAGRGGTCFGGGGGGTGGAYSGSTSNGDHGEYAGGFILLLVKGNLTIGTTGQLLADGGNGGNGTNGNGNASTPCSGGGGGGGAGGGVIALRHKGTYTNNGNIQVNGGTGGVGGAYSGSTSAYNGNPGASGSVGTIDILQL